MSSGGSGIGHLAAALRSWGERSAHALRRIYYRHLFREKRPGAELVGRFVTRWERRHELHDVPLSRFWWERDFEKGYWSYMREVDEAPRYAVITGYLRTLVPDGDVLDVGCGEGILLRHLSGEDTGSYLGLDISTTAVRRARDRGGPDRHFAVADAESPPVEGPYDAVVLNEVLYYLHRPLAAVDRYREMLDPEGVMILSTYHGSPRAKAILRGVEDTLPLEAESDTTSAGNTWTCSVFRPGSS